MMHVSFTTVEQTGNEGDLFCWFFEDQEGGLLSYFFGTFFNRWLALYEVLSKPNFFVLGFWGSNGLKFLRL